MTETGESTESPETRFADQPVHARKVPPEVAGTVGGRHFLGIDHHWVALRGRRALKQSDFERISKTTRHLFVCVQTAGESDSNQIPFANHFFTADCPARF